MRVLAPVHPNDGSSYYRLIAPAPFVHENELEIKLHRWRVNKLSNPFARMPVPIRYAGFAHDYLKMAERWAFIRQQAHTDFLWLSRSLLGFPNRLEGNVRNLIYDFDDALWLSAEASHCFEGHCKRARMIFAGNPMLANEAGRFNRNVKVVPTSVDVNIFFKKAPEHEKFVVGWIGSSAGFGYLEDIEDQLHQFFAMNREARLVVVSERRPTSLRRLQPYMDFIPWNREDEAVRISSFSVGLMPLRETDWDRGKCGLKMLQYMACEVPVIVSAVGVNSVISGHEKEYGKFGLALNGGENWTEALTYVHSLDRSVRSQWGVRGRKIVVDHYSTVLIAGDLKRFLRECQ